MHTGDGSLSTWSTEGLVKPQKNTSVRLPFAGGRAGEYEDYFFGKHLSVVEHFKFSPARVAFRDAVLALGCGWALVSRSNGGKEFLLDVHH